MVAIVIEAIDGVTTTMLQWRSRCRAGDDGDHDGASEMEIRTRCFRDGDHEHGAPVTMVIIMVLRRWRSQAQDDDGHIISLILIACDVNPLCILSCFD